MLIIYQTIIYHTIPSLWFQSDSIILSNILKKCINILHSLPSTFQGIIRLHIIAGRELKKADIGLIGKGKSDPYCKIYGKTIVLFLMY